MKGEASPIPNVEELIKSIENSGLLHKKVDYSSEECVIQLADPNLQTLLDFAKMFDRKMVFYQYFYLSKDDFIFTNTETDRRGNELFRPVQKYLLEHNKRMESTDFSKPLALTVFCLFEGHSVGITITDPIMAELTAYSKDNIKDKLQDIADDSYKKKEAERIEENRVLREELSEKILKDPEFSKMKNATLREKYLDDLLDKPENAKYAGIFETSYSGRRFGTKDFITLVWSKYRELSNS